MSEVVLEMADSFFQKLWETGAISYEKKKDCLWKEKQTSALLIDALNSYGTENMQMDRVFLYSFKK